MLWRGGLSAGAAASAAAGDLATPQTGEAPLQPAATSAGTSDAAAPALRATMLRTSAKSASSAPDGLLEARSGTHRQQQASTPHCCQALRARTCRTSVQLTATDRSELAAPPWCPPPALGLASRAAGRAADPLPAAPGRRGALPGRSGKVTSKSSPPSSSGSPGHSDPSAPHRHAAADTQNHVKALKAPYATSLGRGCVQPPCATSGASPLAGRVPAAPLPPAPSAPAAGSAASAMDTAIQTSGMAQDPTATAAVPCAGAAAAPSSSSVTAVPTANTVFSSVAVSANVTASSRGERWPRTAESNRRRARNGIKPAVDSSGRADEVVATR